VVVPLITIVSNQLSRDVERGADAVSLELTRDPDPPPVRQFLLGTHPTTLQRIGQAEAFRRSP
jgi:STE24 endopeptidase